MYFVQNLLYIVYEEKFTFTQSKQKRKRRGGEEAEKTPNKVLYSQNSQFNLSLHFETGDQRSESTPSLEM